MFCWVMGSFSWMLRSTGLLTPFACGSAAAEQEFKLKLASERSALAGESLTCFMYSHNSMLTQKPPMTMYMPRGTCPGFSLIRAVFSTRTAVTVSAEHTAVLCWLRFLLTRRRCRLVLQ